MDVHEFLQVHERREFLKRCAGGIGTVALAHLLDLDGRTAGAAESRRDPLTPRQPHFLPRAKNVIYIFMAGAPSQIDLYDPKPEMKEWHGKSVPGSLLDGLDDILIRSTARVFASPRTFSPYGQSGTEFSDFLPRIGACADDICLIRTMHTDVANHHPGQLIMNCGLPRFGFPSMGAWVTYGLGSESRDLPGFLVLLSSSGLGLDGGTSLWSSGFLPSEYRAVTLRSGGEPVLSLAGPADFGRPASRARLDAIGDLNRIHLDDTGDREIASRIASYEMAFRMQASIPGLVDVARESARTKAMYGLHSDVTRPFGTNCLLARRMVERGVRFVQLYHTNWDDHSNLNARLKKNCDMTDLPTAALLRDLKDRGLLDDTLVIWGGEFGRTPMAEVRRGNTPGKEGRDHHPFAFSMWMAGGGVRGGQVVGQTDEFGYHPVKDPVHVHDLQATILRLLGIDHERLTYRHRGRDFRLTDVAGNVVEKILA